MTRTAFITGSSGFIGNHLVGALLDAGWKVKILVHTKEPLRAAECQVVRGDIEDFHLLLNELRGVDTVFHLAAALGGSMIKPSEFYRINSHGTVTVLEAAGAAQVKDFVHFSSAGVLGHIEENEAADEKHPLFPVGDYDNSKLLGENTALEFAEKGLRVIVVRPGWVYGPGDRRTFKLVRAVAKGRFVLVSSGETRQTPVHIADLIAGTLQALEKGRSGEIYHLAGSEVLTVTEMAETIGAAVGKKIPRVRLPLFVAKAAAWSLGGVFRLFGKEAPITKGRLAFFIHPKPLAVEKAREELGYAPRYTFRSGMDDTITWCRANGWLK